VKGVNDLDSVWICDGELRRSNPDNIPIFLMKLAVSAKDAEIPRQNDCV
jgi:hypothetical protein